MTHSPVSITLAKVSFVVLSATLLLALKTTIGGFELKQLKKLNGARFTLPLASILLTNAMGRGATMASKN